MKYINSILNKLMQMGVASALIAVTLGVLDEFGVFGSELIEFENVSLRLVNAIERIPRKSRGSIRFINSFGQVQVLHSDGNFAYFSNIGVNKVPEAIEVAMNDEYFTGAPIKLRGHIPQGILSKITYVGRDSWLGRSRWKRWRLDIEVDLHSKRVDWLLSEAPRHKRGHKWYWCASKTEMYGGLSIRSDWIEGPVYPDCKF